MTSPTQVVLKHWRAEGWTCAVVEHWNPYAKVRQDLFGGIDILAIHSSGHMTVGIQATTFPNMGARVRKLTAIAALKEWVLAGNDLVVAGVRPKKRGQPVQIEVRKITLEDFIGADEE